MNTFAETESLLLTAVKLSNNSIKQIAVETGIKSSTLYKWVSTDVHLSPQKADTLLIYFRKNEPFTLLLAEIVIAVTIKVLLYSALLLVQDVAEKEEDHDKLFPTAERTD